MHLFLIIIFAAIQILYILSNKNLIFIHKIIGCVSSILASTVLGTIIYALDINSGLGIDLSFSIVGWLMLFLSLLTYFAKIKCDNKCSLRLCIIYTILFYRISYLFLCGYRFTNSQEYKSLEEILNWFFIFPLACVEILIRFEHKNN